MAKTVDKNAVISLTKAAIIPISFSILPGHARVVSSAGKPPHLEHSGFHSEKVPELTGANGFEWF